MLHLRLYLKNYWESQEDEFSFVKYETHFSSEAPCNIYLVGIRPRVIIDPEYLKVEGSIIELLFKIQDKYKFKEIKAKLPLNRPIEGHLIIESTPPYSRFNIRDDKGYHFDKEIYSDKNSIEGKAIYALRQSEFESDINFNDLEILYIGKSVKMDKKISPLKRVQNHYKIQKILQKCTNKYFDKEVYILLCSFVKKLDLLAPTEHLQLYKNGTSLIDKLEKDILTLNATHELTTQLSEATLIDYFNTREFNQDFIGSFGRNTHSYFPYVKKSQISTITLEVDLTKLCRVYSQTIKPKNYHSVKYFPKDNFLKTTEKLDNEFDKY